MARTYIYILSAFFVIEGLWGFFSEEVFWVFTTNTIHSLIHLFVGILGFTWGANSNPRMYCTLVGLLLLVSGVLYLVEGSRQMMVNAFNMNASMAWFNVIAGPVTLLIGNLGRRAAVVR